jgi:hypothetical protein
VLNFKELMKPQKGISLFLVRYRQTHDKNQLKLYKGEKGHNRGNGI